jgi:hypothetical protein
MKHGKTPGSFQDAGAKALRANFRKVEHREWWLWVAAAIITLPARSILQIEDLEVDRVSHTVRRGNGNIDLSPKEFALLEIPDAPRGPARFSYRHRRASLEAKL